MGPGLFIDIGKKAKDLLTKDYSADQIFSVSSSSAAGVTLTSTALSRDGVSTGDIAAVYKYKNAVFGVNFDTESNILATVTFAEIFPSTNAAALLKLPDCSSGKLEVQYFRDHGTVTTAVTLNQSPSIDITATIGTSTIAFGAGAGYDANSAKFTNYAAGISVTKPDLCASIILADKGDTLKATYLHHLDELKRSAAVGEITRKLSTNENTFTVGASYAIDNLTLVKAKVNSIGKVEALLQHEIMPKSLLTICSELDAKALEKYPKFGLGILLNP